MNGFNRLQCPKCGRFYKNSAPVVLDVWNTVIHMKSYTTSDFNIKDKGTYRSITHKYDFFEEMHILNK